MRQLFQDCSNATLDRWLIVEDLCDNRLGGSVFVLAAPELISQASKGARFLNGGRSPSIATGSSYCTAFPAGILSEAHVRLHSPPVNCLPVIFVKAGLRFVEPAGAPTMC